MMALRCISTGMKNIAFKNICKFSSLAIDQTILPSVSVVKHPFPIDGTPISFDKEILTKDLFAVVEFSGSQFKVTVDDVIVAHRIPNIEIDDIIDLDKVLLVGNRNGTVVGRPVVPGAKVLASVEEIAKDKKVITLKVRRRKNSQNIKGFRRQVTILRIREIILSNETAGDMGVV